MTEALSVAELMAQLDAWAVSLDNASTRLSQALREYEGDWKDKDTWEPGPKLRWEESVADEVDEILSTYEREEKRAPAKSVVESRAAKAVKRKDFQLYADYHRLKAETEGLQKWISSKKESISARQSVLSAEKTLAGNPPQGPKPQWSQPQWSQRAAVGA